MQDFRNLRVWQDSHRLALSLYKLTASFPRSEIYGLTSQIRRAVTSVAANICEGSARSTDAATRAYLDIAQASAAEVECLLLLARDLGYLSAEQHRPLEADTVAIRRMLTRFRTRLQKRR